MPPMPGRSRLWAQFPCHDQGGRHRSGAHSPAGAWTGSCQQVRRHWAMSATRRFWSIAVLRSRARPPLHADRAHSSGSPWRVR
jgi:hypothetical protein